MFNATFNATSAPPPQYVKVPVKSHHSFSWLGEAYETVTYDTKEVPSVFSIFHSYYPEQQCYKFAVWFGYLGMKHRVYVMISDELVQYTAQVEYTLKRYVTKYLLENVAEYEPVLNSYWGVDGGLGGLVMAKTIAPTFYEDSAISAWASKLPAIQTKVRTECACSFSSYEDTLYNAIIHLNDTCKWSREKIADWIDDLHDRGIINAEFQEWEEDQALSESSKANDAALLKKYNLIVEKFDNLAKETKNEHDEDQ